jgi:hypothetical protein
MVSLPKNLPVLSVSQTQFPRPLLESCGLSVLDSSSPCPVLQFTFRKRWQEEGQKLNGHSPIILEQRGPFFSVLPAREVVSLGTLGTHTPAKLQLCVWGLSRSWARRGNGKETFPPTL